MQMIDCRRSTDAIIPDPESSKDYLVPGRILKMFNNSNIMSEPTIWGSSSSGYMESRE